MMHSIIIMSYLIIKASSYTARFQNEDLTVCGFLRVLALPSDPGGHKWHKQTWIVFNIVSALDKPYYNTRHISNY